MDDITSFSHRKLSTILKNPNHPHHSAAKAERDRREMQKESKDEFPHMMYDPKTGKGYMARKPADHDRMNKMGYTHDKPKTEGAMKRIATTQSNKADRTADGGKKGLETFKKREMQKEAKGAPKMQGDSIAIQRAKDKAHADAMGRHVASGRKKTMTSTQKSLASMQKETKGAPKGYHFTRDGKLRKGDAGADGDGGAKLRSDPLDKQRSKIPPLPEKFANPAQQAAVMAKLKKSGKYDGKEAYDEPQSQAKGMMSPLQKARMDKEKADRDRDGKLMNVKSKPKTEATMKSFSEISRSKLGSYGKAAAKDIDKQRNTVKGALDQPASPKHAKAGMDAMKKLHKRSRGSDMYVNKMTGRSKVKPTAEETVNELDKKTLGSYIKKAGPDAVKQTAQAKRHSDAGDMADKDKDMYKAYGKSQRAMDKAKNRQTGISKAVDKLTREATADPATVRMMKDNPHMIGQDGPGGMKGLKKNTQKKVKQTLGKDAMDKAKDKLTREATIPDGQTAMTKRPELTNNDKDKLAKIRKMLDREKKK